MKYFELIITMFISYFVMLIALRFLGKKELSQLTVLDLIVFLIMSELITLSIDGSDMNIYHSSFLSLRNKKIKKVLEGQPCYIIYQGKVNQQKMTKLNYSVNDLCHHLREKGVGSISDVEFAILETNVVNLSMLEIFETF